MDSYRFLLLFNTTSYLTKIGDKQWINNGVMVLIKYKQPAFHCVYSFYGLTNV